ncbi:MAG: CCA tRNA nucleotidyltransferase [Verrucomicrobiales bacterium]|nr:CCA tRNA nucleotidyltransferase [Verrucomicrobiales bacterium]
MDSNKAAAVEIIGKLQKEGHVAYLAGGCVRDMLRGEIPKDYDIATSALPEQITTIFSKTREVGVHFGVVIVIKENQAFDVATFRNDGSYKDGRHPEEVTFSTPEEDTARRDFTINGIFFDPISQKYIDFVNGRSDIEKKVVRAIGDPDLRFQEDHLRLLRAVRFAARFNYEIEEKTWKSIKLNASEISKISKERVRDELTKILLNENRVLGFDLLVDSGLMEHIIPEILQLKGCEQPPQFHPEGDVFVHTRLMLSLLKDNPSIELVLGVLLHDIGKPATYSFDEAADRIRFNGHDKLGAEMSNQILRDLKFSNSIIEDVVQMVANHMTFKDVQKMRQSKLKRFISRSTFSDEKELHRVDCLGSWGGLDNYDFLNEKMIEFANEPIIPAPLLTGKDLIEFGWAPGPNLGETLNSVQDLQLEGTLNSKEEALEWVKANRSKNKLND